MKDLQSWWWAGLILLALFLFYPWALQNKKNEIRSLSLKLKEKELEKLAALSKREELELQINSQNDPSWIEMLLIRDLGMVPEGWLKVHFIPRP